VDKLTNGNPAWNVFTGAHFVGPLDLSLLERAINEIIRRHEILRTKLVNAGGQVVQIILPEHRVEAPVTDLRGVEERDRQTAARRLIGETFRQIFDLSAGPPVRIRLFRLGDEEYQMLVVMHHTMTDWISYGVLNKELALIYEAFSEDKPSPLPPLPIQYGDFAIWERELLRGELANKQIAYWKERLAGAPPGLNLPYDYLRPPVQTYWGAREQAKIGKEVSESLRMLSEQERVTLFITALTILFALLHACSSQQDIVIGTPVIGRKRSEIENLIGLFLNHLPLRVDLTGNPTFRELLGRVRDVVIDGYKNQDLPFGKLVEELHPANDSSRNPVFQVMFFFLEVPAIPRFSNLTLKPFEAYAGTARYDLLISLWDRHEGISGFFEYNIALFKPETVAQMASRYSLFARKVAENSEQRISDLT
jgi:hypothetical protein